MLIQNIKSKEIALNSLISLIPISYIAGNLILNLNIFIFIIASLFLYGYKVFEEKFTIFDKIILAFFLYILLNSIWNNFFNLDNQEIIKDNLILKKSFLFFRFFLLYLILKFLIKNDLINYKFIFLSFGASSLFVSFDLIIQYVFGRDLFGFTGSGRRLSGPFGDEYIAGSFIQRFFIFAIFANLFFLNNKKNLISKISYPVILIITAVGLLLAGNRIPLLLFIFTLGIIFFFQKELRKSLIIIFLIFASALSYFMTQNENVKSHYMGFAEKSFQIIKYLKIKITNNELKFTNTYIKEIETGIYTWEENKIFGSGVKSFYFICSNIDRSKISELSQELWMKGEKLNCNTHPHNYYLQIAAELGLVGLMLIISIFTFVLIKCLNKTYNFRDKITEIKLLTPFWIIFFIEVFPLKTTGNFFTTTNSTFIFIILTFVVGLIEKRKNNE